MFCFLGCQNSPALALTLRTAIVRHKPGGLPVDFAMLEHCMDLAKNKAKAVVLCFLRGDFVGGIGAMETRSGSGLQR